MAFEAALGWYLQKTGSEGSRALSAEQVPVSAYGRILKNLKDPKEQGKRYS